MLWKTKERCIGLGLALVVAAEMWNSKLVINVNVIQTDLRCQRSPTCTLQTVRCTPTRYRRASQIGWSTACHAVRHVPVLPAGGRFSDRLKSALDMKRRTHRVTDERCDETHLSRDRLRISAMTLGGLSAAELQKMQIYEWRLCVLSAVNATLTVIAQLVAYSRSPFTTPSHTR